MDRELARKLPAIVTQAGPLEVRPVADRVLIKAASRGQLSAEITRRWRAGEIEREYRTGRQGDHWVAEVVPKRPRPRWLRPALLAAVGLAVLGVAVWVVKVVVAALVALLPFILGGLGILALLFILAMISGGGGSKTINIKM